MKKIFLNILFVLSVCSSVAQQPTVKRNSLSRLLNDTALKGAHVGISIYDPVNKQSILSYQADRYFIPASNVKIITCYAAMKYLKHILPGIRYYENDTAIYLVPTGDPTFLHRDFQNQPVIKFLQAQQKKIFVTDQNWHDKELGKGWSWDDFSDEYMTERNALPVYGNTLKWVQQRLRSNDVSAEESFSVYSDPEVNWKVRFDPDPLKMEFEVKRHRNENVFSITEGTDPFKEVYVPFITNGLAAALELLPDTIHKPVAIANNFLLSDPGKHTISSQPTDSVLRPMMYRSDNFFAEQLLLMVSEEMFGIMDAELTIDSLLRTDFSTLPQKPVWVDGSGLSRYNLFSPSDFVRILDSMRIQFGMDRLKAIFPTGDSGTLKGMFLGGNNPYAYAKTGSMSGVLALSGFLYTRDNRILLFSVLVNNFAGRAGNVKRAVERFVKEFR